MCGSDALVVGPNGSGQNPKEHRMNAFRKALLSAGLVGTTLVGGAVGAALLNGTANAAETSTSSTAPAPAGTDPGGPGGHGGRTGGNFDPTRGGHVGQNGVTEVLLTGDTAAKVKAAALAA